MVGVNSRYHDDSGYLSFVEVRCTQQYERTHQPLASPFLSRQRMRGAGVRSLSRQIKEVMIDFPWCPKDGPRKKHHIQLAKKQTFKQKGCLMCQNSTNVKVFLEFFKQKWLPSSSSLCEGLTSWVIYLAYLPMVLMVPAAAMFLARRFFDQPAWPENSSKVGCPMVILISG